MKKARKTAPSKKFEVDEETQGTIGAAGIFGVAVLTAGSLFLNSAPGALNTEILFSDGQVRRGAVRANTPESCEGAARGPSSRGTRMGAGGNVVIIYGLAYWGL